VERVFVDDLLAIFDSDLSEADKLARSFDYITRVYIQHAEQEIELLKAIDDKDLLIKEQIKSETIKHVRNIFNDCFMRSTGKKAWND
jgi:hypothetical protein